MVLSFPNPPGTIESASFSPLECSSVPGTSCLSSEFLLFRGCVFHFLGEV